MPKERTIDEMIEDEQARRAKLKKAVAPFTPKPREVPAPQPAPKELPANEESPLAAFVDMWKTGIRRILRR